MVSFSFLQFAIWDLELELGSLVIQLITNTRVKDTELA